MDLQQRLVNFTGPFEGCRLNAYLCPAGVPTIGYGKTRGVKMGDTCTQAQADAWLLEDLQFAIDAVKRIVKVPLTEGQQIALVDFVFNCGVGAFERSTLLRCLHARRYADAALEFLKWNKGGGKVLPGLVKRCKARQDMFEAG